MILRWALVSIDVDKLSLMFFLLQNILHFYLSSCPHHLYFAPDFSLSVSKGSRGSSWVATSLSFPLRLLNHSTVACSIRAEPTPGSLPEASARRSPLLPAHLSDPLRMEHHCPGCYLMAPIHRQTKQRARPPPSP